MTNRTDGKMVSMLFVIALLAVGLTAGGARGARPAAGTIRWGDTVAWSGELTQGGAIIPRNAPEIGICPEGACDDFLLDIQIERSPNANRIRFVDILINEIKGESALEIDLVVFPPSADLTRDGTEYISGGAKAARLLDPEPGVWRVQVRCFSAEACRNTATFEGSATTGALRLPRAVAHRSGARRASVPGKAPVAEVHQVGANAFEPTMGVTEGAFFYQGSWPKVLRSEDGGQTWANVSPRVERVALHRLTFDPLIHVDEDTSRVFTVDMIPPFACNQLSFSDDGGTAWTTTAICEHAPDHQNLFTGPPVTSTTTGYPNIVYWCVNGNGFMTAACSKSLDGGLTFIPTGSPAYANPWPVEENDECSVAGVGHGVVGSDGTVYLPRGHCGQPFLAISRDEGLTWTQVQVADNGMPVGSPIVEDLPGENVGEHETAVAVDEEGTLYYTWMGYNRLPYLAISRDGGLSWSDPMMIGPPRVNEAALPAIAVGAPGKIAVAYMATENSPGGPPFPGEREGTKDDTMREGYEGVTWNGYITVTDSALAADPLFFTAPVNNPHDPLVVGTCGPTRCARAGDFFDVVIGPDGIPSAAFVDACVVDRCVLVGEGIVGRLVGGPSLR